MSQLYLGLDSSTQSLTGVVIDLDAGRVVYDKFINFDKALPHYGTRDGVLRFEDPTVIHAPPLMWLEALELLFATMKRDGVALGDLLAISGSGQQHGSVYLNHSAATALENLNPALSLAEQLKGCFSRPTAPVWMDSSTTRACEEIARTMEPHGGLVQATGSAAIERFTGPQIRAFWQQDPAGYAKTSQVALVSSFMCSALAGRIAPIDPGDGAGMNLMDIRTLRWHAQALAATAPGLAEKLPPLARSGTVVGTIGRYWADKFGVNPSAKAVIWSGDNPCSVVGLGLVNAGQVAISMGTSYTYFGTMPECHVDPRGEGHVFGSPAGGYMALNCFKNGGLARARVRDQYGLDWEGYRSAMQATPPGNAGGLMLPWFDTEIVPKVLTPGVHRKNLKEADVSGNCRALVEAQMMAMKLHGNWMDIHPSVIYATGGASEDRSVLQVMADVFACPAQPFAITKSAALGAALIAAQAVAGRRTWDEIVSGFTQPSRELAVAPDAKSSAIYADLIKRYADFERSALSTGHG